MLGDSGKKAPAVASHCPKKKALKPDANIFERDSRARCITLVPTLGAGQNLEIICLNCQLDGATFVPEMRKPFDVLAEGLVSENSRGDRTSIELFMAGVSGWEVGLRRVLDG